MPNAGIQSTRSTNWKSAIDGSKRLHSSSVPANTSSDTMSAMLLTSRSPRPWSSPSGTSISRTAPTIGTTTSDVRIGNGITRSQPQVIPEDQHDTDEERRGVRPHRSGLQPAQDVARTADDVADAVDRAVDDGHVDELPQSFFGRDVDRLDDDRVVQLVDVVLVQQHAVDAAEVFGHAIGRSAVQQKEVRGEAD